MEFKHYPVMLEESIDYLDIKENGIYFDGTLGGCGHTEAILKRNGTSKVYATDRDSDSINYAAEKLKKFSGRVELIHDNFKNIKQHDLPMLDGAILDLGISSYQIDNFERGFSYRANDFKLDMRMNVEDKTSAYDIVNGYPKEKLMKIFYEFGEEKFSKRIAENIIKSRPVTTCGQLSSIIVSSVPPFNRRDGHPAKRVFQALRIEVNKELDGLDKAIYDIVDKLKIGGRLAVITFHSLEDRIVKHAFKELEKDCVCDKSIPVCVCNKRKEVNILTNKPILSSERELAENSRSQSSKLRVVQKI